MKENIHILYWIVFGIAVIAKAYSAYSDLPEEKNNYFFGILNFLKKDISFWGILISLISYFFVFNFSLSILGIILLIDASDTLINGAQVVATKAKIPPILIGILIIGLGTSTPELFVNVFSAVNGNTDLAFGNIIGSNISNMALIIGIAGLIAGQIKIQKSIITTEIPIMVSATLLVFVFLLDFPPFVEGASKPVLSRQDGIIMIMALCVYLMYMFHAITNVPQNPEVETKFDDHYKREELRTWAKAIFEIVIGITGLYFGGDFTVSGMTAIAYSLGAGTLVVGIIIGVGTSLPELSAAITCVKRNEPDLAVGNVIGSNIFNILLILGITSLIKPIYLGPGVTGHLLFLLVVTTVFYISLGSKHELSKTEASILTFLGLTFLGFSLVMG